LLTYLGTSSLTSSFLTRLQDIREEEGCKRAIDLVLKEFGSIDVSVDTLEIELLPTC
jgi:hypothetical protein